MKNIAIIGSGSFGCALANHLANKGHNIKVWSFKKEEADAINKEHKCIFIPEKLLNENIRCFTNYKDVIEGSEYILMVTPSNVVRKTIKEMKEYITNQKIVICSKGLEIKTNKLLTEVINEEINNLVGVLSGPSIAKDVLNNKKISVVFASKSDSFNKEIKELFETDSFNIEISEDAIGVQLGGAFKNIGAIAYGYEEGKNQDSEKILKDVLEEIKLIGTTLGAKEETFDGLSCLGDLIVTSKSKDSRNHKAGILLSKGKTKEEIKEEIGAVIEGFDSLEIAYDLGKKYNLNLKIIDNLYKLVNNLTKK